MCVAKQFEATLPIYMSLQNVSSKNDVLQNPYYYHPYENSALK